MAAVRTNAETGRDGSPSSVPASASDDRATVTFGATPRRAADRAERDAAQRQQVLHEHQLSASLPDGSALIKVVRYETMLDRQIHRAFAELRRRQTNVAE